MWIKQGRFLFMRTVEDARPYGVRVEYADGGSKPPPYGVWLYARTVGDARPYKAVGVNPHPTGTSDGIDGAADGRGRPSLRGGGALLNEGSI